MRIYVSSVLKAHMRLSINELIKNMIKLRIMDCLLRESQIVMRWDSALELNQSCPNNVEHCKLLFRQLLRMSFPKYFHRLRTYLGVLPLRQQVEKRGFL